MLSSGQTWLVRLVTSACRAVGHEVEETFGVASKDKIQYVAQYTGNQPFTSGEMADPPRLIEVLTS